MRKSAILLFPNIVLFVVFQALSLNSFACTTPAAIPLINRPYCTSAPRLTSSESGVSYQLLKNGVNHGAPKIGTGSLIDFGTQGIGTYTVVGTRGTCSATMLSYLVVTTEHDGDPSGYGDHMWNVYGYSNSLLSNDSMFYYGYYTQKLAGNEGFNTEDAGTGWATLSSPSSSSTWKGCTIISDDFTFIHKRRGFPCGRYLLTMDQWDDKAKVYVNGVLVWSCNVISGTPLSGCTSSVGEFELDANSTVEVVVKDLLLSSRAKMSFTRLASPTGYALGVNNDSRSCKVVGNQWVDFFTSTGNRYIGSVRGTDVNSNLGVVTLTVSLKTGGDFVPACSNIDNLTAILQRSWLINTISTPNSTIIRLPYLPVEFENLQNNSILSSNPFDVVQFPNQATLFLSRYSGPNQVNTSSSDNCIENGGSAGTVASSALTAGAGLGSVSAYYSDFTVSNNSELWLHGTSFFSALGSISPLFKTDCLNKTGSLEWDVNNSSQMSSYVLEYSESGHDWLPIKEFWQSNQENVNPRRYLTIDPLNKGYYRLVEKGSGDEFSVFGPYTSNCTAHEDDWILYPNPVIDDFKISFGNTTNIQAVDLFDASGHWVKSLFTGGTLVDVKLNVDVPSGIYLVKIISDDRIDNLKMLKK